MKRSIVKKKCKHCEGAGFITLPFVRSCAWCVPQKADIELRSKTEWIMTLSRVSDENRSHWLSIPRWARWLLKKLFRNAFREPCGVG